MWKVGGWIKGHREWNMKCKIKNNVIERKNVLSHFFVLCWYQVDYLIQRRYIHKPQCGWVYFINTKPYTHCFLRWLTILWIHSLWHIETLTSTGKRCIIGTGEFTSSNLLTQKQHRIEQVGCMYIYILICVSSWEGRYCIIVFKWFLS